jgi:hypothetical protein
MGGDSRKWSVGLSLKVGGFMMEFVFAGFPPNGPFRNSILLASFRYFLKALIFLSRHHFP